VLQEIQLLSVHKRVDTALAHNRRAEKIVILMAVGTFLLGLGIIITGYWSKNLYITVGATVLQGFLYWPINEVLKLRRDNIILQTTPVIVSTLDSAAAADEIRKFLAYLRKDKSVKTS
jgi:hypothetical protein